LAQAKSLGVLGKLFAASPQKSPAVQGS